MKVSLRLILIEDDEGAGVNVKPLAQQEIISVDMDDDADKRAFLVEVANWVQRHVYNELSGRIPITIKKGE